MSIRMDVAVDQTDGATISVDTLLLGPDPYALVQFKADPDGGPDDLLIRVEIGGREENVTMLGTLLRIAGSSIEQQGADLAAQALASEDRRSEGQARVPGSPS